MIESHDGLLNLLDQAPVMGSFHPLLPLALPSEIHVVSSAQDIAEAMDALEMHIERRVLINEYEVRYKDRFLVAHYQERPPISALNCYLPERLFTPLPILTHTSIASRVRQDVLVHGYQAVILLLVDGLSYEEVRDWPYRVEPCIVNGPSKTFARTETGKVAEDVGFAHVVGKPPLARLLQEVGLHHSRGYSYWERGQNDVSAHLFRGMPLQRVHSIRKAIDTLSGARLSGLYIQIVREGTDGLAHRRREVRPAEVRATVDAIRDDFKKLVNLLTENEVKGAVYLTSDHGMLWKQEHELQLLSHGATSPRYTEEPPADHEVATSIIAAGRKYFLYHYPYIGRRIRANDSGVHGGLSYQESVVPFVHVEVN